MNDAENAENVGNVGNAKGAGVLKKLRLRLGKDFFSAKNIAVFGVLLAVSIVLQIFGGSIQIGVASLNFTLVPLVLAALLYGAWGGAFIGAVNGVIVFLTACVLAPSGLFVAMFAMSPFMMFLICFLKTTAAGFISGLLFDIVACKNERTAVFVASGIAPVINTGIFVLGMLCLYNDIAEIIGDSSQVVYTIFVGCVSFNFFIELAINLLVAPALYVVYRAVEKQFKK